MLKGTTVNILKTISDLIINNVSALIKKSPGIIINELDKSYHSANEIENQKILMNSIKNLSDKAIFELNTSLKKENIEGSRKALQNLKMAFS